MEIKFKIPNFSKYYYNFIYWIKLLFKKIKNHKEIKRNLKILNLYEFSSKKYSHLENLYPQYNEFQIKKKKLYIYHFIIKPLNKPLFKIINIPIIKLRFFFNYKEQVLLEYITLKCNIQLLKNTIIIITPFEKIQIIPEEIKYNSTECSIIINNKYTIYLKRYENQFNKICQYIIGYFDLKIGQKP